MLQHPGLIALAGLLLLAIGYALIKGIVLSIAGYLIIGLVLVGVAGLVAWKMGMFSSSEN